MSKREDNSDSSYSVLSHHTKIYLCIIDLWVYGCHSLHELEINYVCSFVKRLRGIGSVFYSHTSACHCIELRFF